MAQSELEILAEQAFKMQAGLREFRKNAVDKTDSSAVLWNNRAEALFAGITRGFEIELEKAFAI